MTGLLALLLAAAYAADTCKRCRWADGTSRGGDLPACGCRVAGDLGDLGAAGARHRGTDDLLPATFSLPVGADLRRLLLVLSAFAIYFAAMPVIGNMIASALFLFAGMWLLSDGSG